MIGRIIIGLVVVGAGCVLVIKTEWMLSWFGKVPFAEKYLGTEGGSRLFYKFLGLAACFFGFIIAANLTEKFFRWLLPDVLFGG